MKREQLLEDYRKKGHQELKAELRSLLKEAFTLNMQKHGDGLEKTHLIRKNRRNVARLKTVITEQIKGQGESDA